MNKKLVSGVLLIGILVFSIFIISVSADNGVSVSGNGGGITGIFGMVRNSDYVYTNFSCWHGISSCWTSIESYSFYLPYDSYVYIEVNGNVNQYDGISALAFAIDDAEPCHYDKNTYRSVTGGNYIKDINIQIASSSLTSSRVFYLNSGTHVVYLNGMVTRDVRNLNMPYVSGISISVIVNSNGGFEIR